jgi:amidase
VVRAYLDRIYSVNPAINAAVQIASERALSDAASSDRQLASGQGVGPLHGVPFTVKDVFDTEGILTAVGLSERASYVPPADAVVVARMRSAGAILIAKTANFSFIAHDVKLDIDHFYVNVKTSGGFMKFGPFTVTG